jgi:hypothetical protein
VRDTSQGETTMPRRIKTDPTSKRDALLLEIAQRQFHIETLETRNRDRLDFHDVAVWALRAALEEAFDAGRAAGRMDADQRVAS